MAGTASQRRQVGSLLLQPHVPPPVDALPCWRDLWRLGARDSRQRRQLSRIPQGATGSLAHLRHQGRNGARAGHLGYQAGRELARSVVDAEAAAPNVVFGGMSTSFLMSPSTRPMPSLAATRFGRCHRPSGRRSGARWAAAPGGPDHIGELRRVIPALQSSQLTQVAATSWCSAIR